MCSELPPSHWHCAHGHLIDCPSPLTCPPLKADDEPKTYAVRAGHVLWLYASARTAENQLRVLADGGVEGVTYRRGLSAVQVDDMVRELPQQCTVEDCR